MHELPITQSILDIVVKHAHTNNVKRVLSITLRIGELSDLEDEWIQRYFDYLSKDTVAEKAKLKIERSPVVMRCNECSHSFEARIKEKKEIACPKCGSTKNFSLISGREYYVKDMEVQ
ncbi:MAG: hydrogenase maturation nickel metallochaperone HypA [Thermodesulfobacteriota bacterium]|nr:hydrogenase maturation nickel metallochaperone HypA [Thermodesulfobacteriota bacterium]